MVTAAQKAELTEWFKPENYEVLKGITIYQLCQEFRHRRAMFDELEEALESDEADWCVSQANLSERDLIIAGNPLLNQPSDINSVNTYESDQHVRVMSAGQFISLIVKSEIRNCWSIRIPIQRISNTIILEH